LQASVSSHQLQYDTLKAELEAKNLQLRDREAERDSAIHEGERQRSDNRNLARELADSRNKNTDLQAQLEAARKEVVHLTERTRILEHERSELLYEKDRLQDELKRANARIGEISRELEALTVKYETVLRDINNLRTTLRTTESERDEHVTVIERLRHEIKDKTTRLGHTESYVSDLNLRLEQSKREITTTNEKLTNLTVDIETLKATLSDRQDALRLVNIERDNLRDDVETERRKVLDIQRTVTHLQDQALRTENTTAELRAEAIKLTETIRETERSRDEARHRHGPFEKEIAILKEKLALALRQHGEQVDAHNNARRELDEFRVQYEETIESIESYQESGQELEFEIESLRTLLAEAREQKERAISARNSADRERDQSIAAFEEKCRQLERFEEQKISQFHSLQKAEGQKQSGSSRIVSRSTVMHSGGGHSSSEHHGGHSGSIAHHGGHEHHHEHQHEHQHGNGEARDEEL
jgi:chromosome segregation ATPase